MNSSKRINNESYKKYRKRIKNEQKLLKIHLRGKVFYDPYKHLDGRGLPIPYVKAEHPELNKEE